MIDTVGRRWISESLLSEFLDQQLQVWGSTEIAPEHLIKQLRSQAKYLADIQEGGETRMLCGNRWPLLPDEVQCDRKSGHTGKHRSRERHMQWWGGPK